MSRSLLVSCLLSCMVIAAAVPAVADAPQHEVMELAGLALECDGQRVTFTSGAVVSTVHVHEGRRGGTQLVFTSRLQDAWLVSEDGQTLRAVGSASNASVIKETDGEQTEVGTFVANFTLIGDNGKEGAVHLLIRGTKDGVWLVERGDCQIAW